MVDIITIAGSPSSSSRSAAALEYARRVVERHGLRTRTLHVRDLPPEDLIYARFDSPAIIEWTGLIRAARGVIISTPVYKAAYSGVLKTFLDLLPQQALVNKVVLPIATGGSPAHMLAIDYALRPVLASLGSQHTLSGVYIVDTQIQYSDEGIQFDPAIAQRLDSGLQQFVQALPEPIHQPELRAQLLTH